jgi:hypothetical protein
MASHQSGGENTHDGMQMCDITKGADSGESGHHCTMAAGEGDGESAAVCSCTNHQKQKQHILYNTPDKNALLSFLENMIPGHQEAAFFDPVPVMPRTVNPGIFHPPRA